ncbi:MAG: DUF2157 domain-containing protein [Planctomycetes bacterium]|nr:DUF2157 domain-containing protein [Planctomycetota bacterium]
MEPLERQERVFRARLHHELPLWRDEGLLGDDALGVLAGRYPLPEEAGGSGVALLAVYVLGALLIGGGVLSFVAWHWESLPATVQLALVTGVMLGCHALGWWWWRGDASRPRLGHALVVLGTLVFGADIALVAQVFHVHSDWYGGFGAWALGALAGAWALRSMPHLALAAILACVWSMGYAGDHRPLAGLAPLALAALLVPLAFLERSRAAYALVALAVTAALMVAAGAEAAEGSAVALALLACTALLSAHGLATTLERPGGLARAAAHLAPVAAALGVLGTTGAAYVLSFHEMAEDLSLGDLGEGGPWIAPAAAALLAALALLLAAAGSGTWRPLDHPVALAALGSVVLLILGMALPPQELWLTGLANLALASLAAAAIAGSVRRLERGGFWFGVLLAGLAITSRFLEYRTELWLKAVVFIACGVAVLLVGVLFEQRLREGRAGHAA